MADAHSTAVPMAQVHGGTHYTICEAVVPKAQNMWQYTAYSNEAAVLKVQSGSGHGTHLCREDYNGCLLSKQSLYLGKRI